MILNIPQEEIISFAIITVVILMLALLTKKMEDKHRDEN